MVKCYGVNAQYCIVWLIVPSRISKGMAAANSSGRLVLLENIVNRYIDIGRAVRFFKRGKNGFEIVETKRTEAK